MDDFVLRDRPEPFLQNVLKISNDRSAAKWSTTLHPDRAGLMSAIESAVDIHDLDRFRAWVIGPLNALMSHECLACVEADAAGGIRWFECILHFPVDAAWKQDIDDAIFQMAHRLLRGREDAAEYPCVLLAETIPDPRLHILGSQSVSLENVLILPARFRGGERFFVMLFNVRSDCLEACDHYYRVLLPHLKSAFSRLAKAAVSKPTYRLTQQELAVLRGMEAGKSNREIGELLGISHITVKDHVRKLYRKLDVRTRADAVALGCSAQLLDGK